MRLGQRGGSRSSTEIASHRFQRPDHLRDKNLSGELAGELTGVGPVRARLLRRLKNSPDDVLHFPVSRNQHRMAVVQLANHIGDVTLLRANI